MLQREDGYEGGRGSIKEGVTQGGPLIMVLYVIDMLLLTQLLKKEIHKYIQLWYMDDTGAGGSPDTIEFF